MSFESYFRYNNFYSKFTSDLQFIVSFHYQFGSKYDTPFWKNIEKNASEYQSYSFIDLKEGALSEKLTGKDYFDIPYFNQEDTKELVEGLSGSKMKDYFDSRYQDLKYFL
jgi:hypothetical protein